MKREFGKPLIETVLAGLDLTLVVDTSQAYIPFHGTPTVLLFGRNRLGALVAVEPATYASRSRTRRLSALGRRPRQSGSVRT
jgi:hypothetical protein